jgi:hypothetical protein
MVIYSIYQNFSTIPEINLPKKLYITQNWSGVTVSRLYPRVICIPVWPSADIQSSVEMQIPDFGSQILMVRSSDPEMIRPDSFKSRSVWDYARVELKQLYWPLPTYCLGVSEFIRKNPSFSTKNGENRPVAKIAQWRKSHKMAKIDQMAKIAQNGENRQKEIITLTPGSNADP